MKNRKCKKLRHKKLRSYIPEQKQILAPEDLLNSHEKTVLLIGKPGIGKTSVIHKMLFLWSQKDNRELDYMFYFDEATLSQISNPMSLESLLFGLYCKPLEKDKKEVLQDIDENSENVIIVFDGISTLQNNQSLQKIMNQDLPEAKIVLTCRSELEDDSFLSIRSPRKVYVQGFSKESVCKYFEQVMGSDSEFLSLVLNNQELVSLCHVPMYAFMVAACMSFRNPTSPKCPLTVTEMFVQILRQDLKKAGNKKNSELDEYIKATRPRLTSLMESAFNATMQKAVNLSNIDRVDTEISKVLLKKITIKDTPTSVEQYHAFLHNTVQEFFSAMWLLGNPDEMVKVLQLCYTEKRKHLKHTIPFLCGLLFLLKQNPKLLKSFFFEDQIKRASDYALFRNFMNTLFQLQSDGELMDDDEDVDAVFVCQCLYESQSPDACLLFLEKVNYHLDLSGNELDPHQCCAVSYVISQSNERQVHLSLEDCSVSDAGIQMILRIAPHLRCESSTLSVLGCERPHFTTILDAGGRQMHLPVLGEGFMFRKAGKIIRESSEKISLHLHFEEDSQQLSEDLCCMIFQRLPQINSLRFRSPQSESDEWRKRVNSFLMDLCLQAALYQKEDLHPTVKRLMSCASAEEGEFLLDLFSRVKNYETQTGRNVLPALQPVYQSAPAVWIINLSERKSSLFLEVLKLQTVKKPVELTGWSDEESEVRSFLQCLSYISRLRFRSPQSESDEWRKRRNSFLMDLCLQAALYQKEVIYTTVKRLMLCVCAEEGEFLLDLFSHVKNYETQTGRNVLPALQPVYQSAPTVWIINLSERKSSLFLEVLKLQTVKTPVELTGWPDEESEVRSFLQCLPYISWLRFRSPQSESDEWRKRRNSFLMDLCLQAALYQKEVIHTTVKRLMSCASAEEGEFLLDLFSHVKNYETQTGRNVLPALQPVYQSAPAVWIINLSERNSSLFLEVLKLQTVKKPVELTGWPDEEIEVRSFLQCLPYISWLRISSKSYISNGIQMFLGLLIKAAESERQTGEKTLELLTSVCTYSSFPYGHTYSSFPYGSTQSSKQREFLLDLFSHVKNYETQTGRNVLPALQPVYQSAPAVWIINLSERKSSLFLEVLKLQTVKKPVELTGWSDEESEVRSFLQCLSYISQLRISSQSYISNGIQMFLCLLIKAAESERQTGEKTLELLTSVCTYSSFPYGHTYSSFPYGSTHSSKQSEFLLDLFSYVKNYETQTGRNVLPALQPVYQSAPAVWIINLSERQSSLFLEVLKLQTVKKPVELTGWSDEESEVRSFLQCLPYISQLRISSQSYISNGIQMFLCLLIKAAESERQTGEKTLELLTSVCTYSSFPYGDTHSSISYVYSHSSFPYGHTYSSFPYGSTQSSKQREFLLNLFSHVKNYETQTGRNVLPALQPVYQSAPAVWIINLSERQSSLFLEVLKLQTVKKPVELTGWSDEESEVRSFLQCLSYISQLRISSQSYISNGIQMFLCLLIKAAESERQTGEKTLELLTSVCTYSSFPYGDTHSSISYVYSHSSFPYGSTQSSKQSEFLLDLFSHVKNYETQTGRNVLPALQPVYQLAPAVWIINLSERKSSLFLEVLKLQTVKTPVELTGWSDEESEVRSFLQCLPYISQLRGAELCIRSLCKVMHSREEVEQVALLLQALNFTVSLGGKLSTSSCRFVGRVLGLSASTLNLTLNPQSISLRGSRLLFRHISHLQTLRLDGAMMVKVVRALRALRASTSVTVEELSLILSRRQRSEGELSRVLSSLSSLLRLWNVQCVNLTEHTMEVQPLTVLLCHKGSLTIRLSKETLQQLVLVVYETQEEEFTRCFLQKVGGDLTSCSLNWDVIHYFLQFHPVSVDFRKSNINQQNIRELVSVLDRIQLRCVDRLLLLKLLHCCSVSEGKTAAVLLSALQHRLDFSCSSTLDLTAPTNTLTLSTEDCRVISMTIQRAQTNTELLLQDCEMEEAGVEQLYTILHSVRLNCSKALLLQFLSLVHVGLDCVRRAMALHRALGEELDLSQTKLDLQACRSLALFLEHSEGLSELDLSHCQLTDHCLELLLPHLHKTHILDLSNNDITDWKARDILSLNSNVKTVRLFNNRITEKQLFMSDRRFEIWRS
uniref:NACHT domain-containing protein n=1 Tax=Pygocentrus nattereri TaxID=42514 RepID=A0AAR2JXI9_PYGNA